MPPSCPPDCPVRKTSRIINGKWTTLILRDLLTGKKRFSELQRSLEDVSTKILSARLKFLESEGIVNRTLFPTVPPKTEYELTPLGENLKHVISAMAQFGDRI